MGPSFLGEKNMIICAVVWRHTTVPRKREWRRHAWISLMLKNLLVIHSNDSEPAGAALLPGWQWWKAKVMSSHPA